jgi:hypothetical protein
MRVARMRVAHFANVVGKLRLNEQDGGGHTNTLRRSLRRPRLRRRSPTRKNRVGLLAKDEGPP